MARKWVTIFGLRVAEGSTLYKWLVRNKDRLAGWYRHVKPKPKVKPVVNPGWPIAMYDSVDTALIPRNAKAAAGYVGGRFHTMPEIDAGPWPYKLSIAISADEVADMLDIENGDATPEQAPAWIRKMRGKTKATPLPVVYRNAESLQALVDLLAKSGLHQHVDYLIGSAHYDGHQHFYGPICTHGLKVVADATQYWDHALNKNLDVWVVSRAFFKPLSVPV